MDLTLVAYTILAFTLLGGAGYLIVDIHLKCRLGMARAALAIALALPLLLAATKLAENTLGPELALAGAVTAAAIGMACRRLNYPNQWDWMRVTAKAAGIALAQRGHSADTAELELRYLNELDTTREHYGKLNPRACHWIAASRVLAEPPLALSIADVQLLLEETGGHAFAVNPNDFVRVPRTL